VEQDEAFLRANPEFGTGEAALKTRERTILPYLQQIGVNPQLAQALYSSDARFRSKEMQQVFWDAAQWNAAKKKARNAAPKLPPVPQKPGIPSSGNAAPDLERMTMAEYVQHRRQQDARKGD